MHKEQIAPGIWLNQLSDRVCTITSKLPNASPDWRISYFGFDKWTDATSFVAHIKRMYDVKCEARKSKRLTTKFEVKVWSLTKQEVIALRLRLEGHTLITKESHTNGDGTIVYDVYLNNQRVIKVHENQMTRLKEVASTLTGSHDDARQVLCREFLFAEVKA